MVDPLDELTAADWDALFLEGTALPGNKISRNKFEAMVRKRGARRAVTITFDEIRVVRENGGVIVVRRPEAG